MLDRPASAFLARFLATGLLYGCLFTIASARAVCLKGCAGGHIVGPWHDPVPVPDGWQAIASAATDNAAAFAWPDHGSALSLEVLPMTAGTDAKAANAILAELRSCAVRKEQFTVEPTVEKDERFALRIHEQFKSADQSVDQWHLYRKVGPRVDHGDGPGCHG